MDGSIEAAAAAAASTASSSSSFSMDEKRGQEENGTMGQGCMYLGPNGCMK
jgi:hypothetical protein